MPHQIIKEVKNISRDRIREVFTKADADNNGSLDKEELKNGFKELGAHILDWRVYRCLKRVDKDKDGAIDVESKEFNELVAYASGRYGFTTRNPRRNPLTDSGNVEEIV